MCDDIDIFNQVLMPSARVACKELGYSGVLKGELFWSTMYCCYLFCINLAEFTPLGTYNVELPNIPIILYLLECKGDEESLVNCSSAEPSIHTCLNWEDAILHCRGECRQNIGLLLTLKNAEQECNGTDVRLVDGLTELDGSIQICRNGLWVSVLANKWDYREAQVVCRQLGYNGSKGSHSICSTFYERFPYTPGSYALQYHSERPITDASFLHCNGYEQRLEECTVEAAKTDSMNIAAILCTGEIIVLCDF